VLALAKVHAVSVSVATLAPLGCQRQDLCSRA